ncbi:hypothetical protein JKP88DRAFT_255227 [Tribonema minus]|uniref:Uncharacterized protein n=1 Tax=Tribonema minus TaxID=303371 RepID=A0A836CGX6_9STRA|nr:hypothetical protein JKP88DRAFT_255227 [Tribonema minus]
MTSRWKGKGRRQGEEATAPPPPALELGAAAAGVAGTNAGTRTPPPSPPYGAFLRSNNRDDNVAAAERLASQDDIGGELQTTTHVFLARTPRRGLALFGGALARGYRQSQPSADAAAAQPYDDPESPRSSSAQDEQHGSAPPSKTPPPAKLSAAGTAASLSVGAATWAETLALSSTLQNRLLACLLSVALLWVTSLSTASWLTFGAIPSPPLVDVYAAVRYAAHVAQEQRNEYAACADAQAPACEADLRAFEAGARAAGAAAAAANAARVAAARAATLSCRASTGAAVAVLQAWTAASQETAESSVQSKPVILNSMYDNNICRHDAHAPQAPSRCQDGGGGGSSGGAGAVALPERHRRRQRRRRGRAHGAGEHCSIMLRHVNQETKRFRQNAIEALRLSRHCAHMPQVPSRCQNGTGDGNGSDGRELTSLVGTVAGGGGTDISAAFGVSAAAYKIQSEELVVHMSTYTQERQAYDAAFAANMTLAAESAAAAVPAAAAAALAAHAATYSAAMAELVSAADDLVSCTSPRSQVVAACKTADGVRVALDSVVTTLQAQLAKTQAALRAYVTAIALYQADVQAAFAAAQALYASIDSALNKLSPDAKSLVSSLLGPWGLLSAALAPSLRADVPGVDGVLTGAPSVATLDEVWAASEGAYEDYQAAAAALQTSAAAAAAALAAQLNATLDAQLRALLPGGYDPPRYCTSAAAAAADAHVGASLEAARCAPLLSSVGSRLHRRSPRRRCRRAAVAPPPRSAGQSLWSRQDALLDLEATCMTDDAAAHARSTGAFVDGAAAALDGMFTLSLSARAGAAAARGAPAVLPMSAAIAPNATAYSRCRTGTRRGRRSSVAGQWLHLLVRSALMFDNIAHSSADCSVHVPVPAPRHRRVRPHAAAGAFGVAARGAFVVRFFTLQSVDNAALASGQLNFVEIFDALNLMWLLALAWDYAFRLLRTLRTFALFWRRGDYAFRLLCTLRTFALFWRRGAINIPDADVSVDRIVQKLSLRNLTAAVWTVITHPFIVGAAAFVVLALMVSQVAVIYKPVYLEYRAGCVDHTANGTFITENAYSVAFNYAAADGTARRTHLQSSHDAKRYALCANLTTSAQATLYDQFTQLQAFAETHADDANTTALIRRCVITEELDADLNSACCGRATADGYNYPSCDDVPPPMPGAASCPVDAGGYAYPPVGPLANNTDCDDDDAAWAAELNAGAVIDCSAMPACAITCPGPNKELLSEATQHAGCMLEWCLHSAWLRLSLTLLVFVLMNLSRLMLVRGVIKLLWRHMHPGLFTFRATCREGGELVAAVASSGGDGAAKADDARFARSVAATLAETLAAWRGTAVAQICMGALLTLPWALALLSVSAAGVAYRPRQ